MMPFAAMRLRKPGTSVPPLLDIYGSAAAAFSVRKMLTSYSGACLRVRTSAAGNAETDIGFDGSGNIDESALSAAIGSNTGTVVTWYDQSGNGVNVTQATVASQPIIVSVGVIQKNNGRVTVFFDGSNDGLASAFSITALNSSRQGSISAVHKSANTTGFGVVSLQRSGGFDYQSALLFERRSTTLSFTLGNGTTGANSTTNYQTQTTPNSNVSSLLLAQTFVDGVGGTRSLYIDGVSGTLTNSAGSLATTGFLTTGSGSHRVILGARSGNQTNTLDNFLQQGISEVVVWGSDQTSNQAGIKSNQSTYFSTP